MRKSPKPTDVADVADDPTVEEQQAAVVAERRAFVTLEDARRSRWDRLSMSKQQALMNEWNAANPPRPGEHPRLRVLTRLRWCQEVLERRERAEEARP